MQADTADGSAELVSSVRAIVAAHAGRRGPLIEILHAVQALYGFIPHEAVPVMATELNLSRAEVQGVIGFYHDFRSAPPGATIVHICRAEACQAMGARQLEAHVKARLGINYHETTDDGRFTLEPVYCLGNCACTPSIRVGDAIYARVTPERFDQIMAADGAGQ
jgi:formate dehydrogenase subunit gamma